MSPARSPETSRPPSPPPCPSCGKPLPSDAPHRPFCSVRCKMVDLGRWLNEEYRVAGESAIAFWDEGDDELAAPFPAPPEQEESGDEHHA